MSNHHNHDTHSHNFINKHTAPAILILIVGCFLAGYFIGSHSSFKMKRYSNPSYRYNNTMMSDYQFRPY